MNISFYINPCFFPHGSPCNTMGKICGGPVITEKSVNDKMKTGWMRAEQGSVLLDMCRDTVRLKNVNNKYQLYIPANQEALDRVIPHSKTLLERDILIAENLQQTYESATEASKKSFYDKDGALINKRFVNRLSPGNMAKAGYKFTGSARDDNDTVTCICHDQSIVNIPKYYGFESPEKMHVKKLGVKPFEHAALLNGTTYIPSKIYKLHMPKEDNNKGDREGKNCYDAKLLIPDNLPDSLKFAIISRDEIETIISDASETAMVLFTGNSEDAAICGQGCQTIEMIPGKILETKIINSGINERVVAYPDTKTSILAIDQCDGENTVKEIDIARCRFCINPTERQLAFLQKNALPLANNNIFTLSEKIEKTTAEMEPRLLKHDKNEAQKKTRIECDLFTLIGPVFNDQYCYNSGNKTLLMVPKYTTPFMERINFEEACLSINR